jgi:hypothetical protein
VTVDSSSRRDIVTSATPDRSRVPFVLPLALAATLTAMANASAQSAGSLGVRAVGPPELAPIRSETREFFFDKFREAWVALDSVAEGAPPVDVAFDPAVAAAATRARPVASRASRIARTLLRPVKPLLEPVASKPLARLAIRRRA